MLLAIVRLALLAIVRLALLAAVRLAFPLALFLVLLAFFALDPFGIL